MCSQKPLFEAMAKGPAEDHLFYRPVKNIPEGFTEAEKSAIEATYHKMITEEIIPRYQKLAVFFKTDYLKAARSTSGIGPLPGSSEFYKNQIEYMTSTNLSADSIFDLGKSEVARIRTEMELVKKEVGFQGSLDDFFIHVRNNKDLMPYTDPQQLLSSFDSIQQRMAPQLAKLFDKKPKTPFMVKRTEAFRENRQVHNTTLVILMVQDLAYFMYLFQMLLPTMYILTSHCFCTKQSPVITIK